MFNKNAFYSSGHFYLVMLSFVIITMIQIEKVSAQETLTVRFMPADVEVGHLEYYNLLLELALNKTIETHGDFEMIPYEESLTQDEALQAVRRDQGLDVFPTMTSSLRERVFIPVRVPLVQGLIGTRLLMINSEDMSRLSDKETLEDLKEIKFGQGSDWPDTRILQRAGLQVEGAESHGELFQMLSNQIIDAFPRAVFEIWDELQDYSGEDFSVAEGYYIYYPTAMYFFTQRSESGRELADRLETGLNKALDDGSFEEVFQQQMGGFLEKADIENRGVIRLENPFLPEDTPTDVAKYWFIDE